MTGRAIRDPVESVKDETLMSVLLLSFYEVRICPLFPRVPLSFPNTAARVCRPICYHGLPTVLPRQLQLNDIHSKT